MPQFNLGEIMSIATRDIGRRSDISQSVASQCANIGYFEVANSVDHALTERLAVSSTTSGENRIDKPTDFGTPINLSLIWSWSTSSSAVSNRQMLKRVAPSYIDERGPYPVGIPEAYADFGSWIELYPSPNSAYSLQMRYRSMVTDMIETSHVPSVATNYRYGIVLKTKELLHESIGNYAGAAAARNAYIDFMARQQSDEARRQADETRYGVGVLTRWSNPRRRTTGDFNMETDWQ